MSGLMRVLFPRKIKPVATGLKFPLNMKIFKKDHWLLISALLFVNNSFDIRQLNADEKKIIKRRCPELF